MINVNVINLINESSNIKLPRRLKPNSKTIGNLLLRSGNQCAFPDCNAVIFNDQNILIAQCCHIEAALPGGERYNSIKSDEQRRSYENLLFLCHEHHILTNDVEKYPAQALYKMKAIHESNYSEKPFEIKPTYLKQIETSFDDIKTNVANTVAIVSRVENVQEQILQILQKPEITIDEYKANISKEYFGAPATFQFKGRSDEGIDLEKEIYNYNTFIVEGISGIGKTTFLANELKKQTEFKIFWVDCELLTSIENLSLRLYNFLKEVEQITYGQLVSSTDHNTLISAITSVVNSHKIAIVFDALNAPGHDFIILIQSR